MSPAPLGCEHVRRQIEAYVDGELTSVECDRIARHCDTCDGCAEIVRRVRQTIELCRGVGASPLPGPVSDRAREQVKRLLGGQTP
jgi:anti-sigma factor RsiW